MGDEKSGMVGGIGNTSRERDRELLIPVADSADDDSSSKPSSSASASHHHSGREVIFRVLVRNKLWNLDGPHLLFVIDSLTRALIGYVMGLL